MSQAGKTGRATSSDRKLCYFSIDFEDYAHDLQRTLGVATPRNTPDSLWRSLEMLEDFSNEHLDGGRLTFFTTGQVAREYPDMVRHIAKLGHEVACHYYEHDQIWHQDRETFRRNLELAVDVLTAASGQQIRGFRAPDFSIDERCSDWAYEELARVFDYDSSYVTEEANANKPLLFEFGDTQLYEFAVWRRQFLPRVNVRVMGGSYFRLLPTPVVMRMLREAWQKGFVPHVYLHPYDILYGKEQWSRYADLGDLPFASRHYWWLRQHQWHSIGNRTAMKKLQRVYEEFTHPGPMADYVTDQTQVGRPIETPSIVRVAAE